MHVILSPIIIVRLRNLASTITLRNIFGREHQFNEEIDYEYMCG